MGYTWLIIEGTTLTALLVGIVLASLSAANRGFIPGLLLISAGILVVILVQLRIIPPSWALIARLLAVALVIPGFVLNERAWKVRRLSRGKPS
jgi:hypothetical protein